MKTESFISWEKLEDCYLIAHLWVAPSERRQGIGRKLLREAIQEMRADGEFNRVELAANSDLEDSENPIELCDLVDFYESEGFKLTCPEVCAMEMTL